MDILKRDLAPISDAAWKEIDEMARETLAANLSGRKFLDVSGPHGIGYTSVDLGRLSLSKDQKKTRSDTVSIWFSPWWKAVSVFL